MKEKGRKIKLLAKINKKRLVISLTVLIILGLFIYNIPSIYDFFMYSDFQTVSGLVGGDFQMERYGGDMLCYNNKEMTLISAKGEAEWSVALSMTSPRILVRDDYILIADLGGKTAYLYDGEKQKAEIKLTEDIFAAALDEKGNIALASKKAGYKGNIAVFDNQGEKQYEFSSGNGYISALDIRKDSLAVAQIAAENDALYSYLVLIDWKDNEEKQFATLKEQMVFDLRYSSNGDITAVSDKGFFGYEDDGEERFSQSFGGRELMKYNIENDDNMVFVLSGDRNNSIIESYSKSGKLRGKRSESGEISSIDVCGEAIIINSMRTLKRVYPDGDAGEAVVSTHDVRGIKLFSSRRHAFITGNSEATVVKVKK